MQKITASYQMQSHMAILIAFCIVMKKDHQTLLNFAILAGKRQKNAPFHIVAFKNFHGRAKGGHRTVALPLNTPLAEVMIICRYRNLFMRPDLKMNKTNVK